MKQRDMGNTGRADYAVPANRQNETFFDSLRWQTRTPNSPSEGNPGAGSMVFFDGAGPGGADLVAGTYHWPKGVQGMDRQTGKVFWWGNPGGGESIANISPAFSPDGGTVYVANDATDHSQMAFAAAVGPAVYWHNGGDVSSNLLGGWSPKIAPDGRIFNHGWCDFMGALSDDGAALHLAWQAASSVNSCWNTPALYAGSNGLLVVNIGRSGMMKAYEGDTGRGVER